MALSSVDIKTTFQYDSDPKDFKFEDTTDYAGQGVALADVTGVIKVVDPLGNTTYNNTNHGSPDIDPDVSLVNSTTILLPLDGSGVPLQGTYVITYTVKELALPDVSVTKNLTLDYSSPTIDLDMSVDCIKPLLDSTDNTGYTSGTTEPTITRDHKIIYPAALNEADVTGTGKVLSTNVFFTKKDSILVHSSSLTSTLSYEFASDFLVTDEVSGTDFINVACDGELCDIYCCIRAAWNRYIAEKDSNPQRASEHLAVFVEMSALTQQIEIALSCGKTADIAELIARIQTIGNCASDCGCDDGEPVQVTGLGGGSADVDVQSGGSPIVVTSAINGTTTVYTISLDADFVATVNNSFNSTIVAGTDISVAEVVDGSGNKTYTITSTAVANTPDILAFNSTITLKGGGNVPDVAIDSVVTKYGAAFDATPVIEDLVATFGTGGLVAGFKIKDFWAAQAGKTFKVSLQIVNIDYNDPTVIKRETQHKVDLEIYEYASDSFSFRFIEKHSGLAMTLNQLAELNSNQGDDIDKIKLSCELIA